MHRSHRVKWTTVLIALAGMWIVTRLGPAAADAYDGLCDSIQDIRVQAEVDSRREGGTTVHATVRWLYHATNSCLPAVKVDWRTEGKLMEIDIGLHHIPGVYCLMIYLGWVEQSTKVVLVDLPPGDYRIRATVNEFVNGSVYADFRGEAETTCSLPFDACFGDADGDGDVDGADLRKFASDSIADPARFAVHFGRRDCAASPSLGFYTNTGCLMEPTTRTAGGGEVTMTPRPGGIDIIHRGATYNCCLDAITVDLGSDANMPRLVETAVLSHPCRCVCAYDVESRVVGVGPGPNLLEYCWHETETALTCVTREILVP